MEKQRTEKTSGTAGARGTLAALPKFIDLGAFAPEVENSFAVAAALAEEVRVTTEIKDAQLAPEAIAAGSGGFVLTLPAMRDGTFVYGALCVRSAADERRIYVAGEAKAGEAKRRAHKLRPPLPQLVRGERLTLADQTTLEVLYEDDGRAAGVDVDAYAFRLYEGGRVRGDADLIFFGNARADDGSIEAETADGKISVRVDIDKVAPAVERIVLCFSVYDDGTDKNFSLVRAPRVILSENGAPKYGFSLDALKREKTVNAAELYRHQGKWKLKLVGAGYEAGLARLCEDYGLSVE